MAAAVRMNLFTFVGQASKFMRNRTCQCSSLLTNYVCVASKHNVINNHLSTLVKFTSSGSQKRCKSVILSAAIGISLLVKKDEENNKADGLTPETGTTIKGILPDDNGEIIHLLKLAKLSEMKQDYPQAEDYYHRALSAVLINQQNKTWSDERGLQAKLYIYSGMANLALLRGQWVAAEKLYKQVMQGLLQQGQQADDNAIIEVSLKLAIIYATQNKTEDAEIGYRFCIEMLEKKLQSRKVADNEPADNNAVALLGMSAEAYGRFLIRRQDYHGALINLQKALEIASNVLGHNHHQIVVLLNDIATVSSLLHDYDTASASLRRAIAIGESTDHENLTTLYCNLGALYSHKGAYSEARSLYGKAVALAKQNKDKEVLKRAEEALASLKSHV